MEQNVTQLQADSKAAVGEGKHILASPATGTHFPMHPPPSVAWFWGHDAGLQIPMKLEK